MKRFVIRLLLIASSFYFLFPMIPGVHFQGNFMHALLAGALFAFLGWLVEFGAIAISTILAVGTLGVALIILIPAWLFGFWLLPAVALRLVADLMPNTLTFTGWVPAIWGGLIMLCIGILTSGDTPVRASSNHRSRAAV